MVVHIAIVGTGVLGLSTALAICESFTECFELTMIGEYGPHNPDMNLNLSNSHDYTSPWAGAHFRPFPSKNVQEYQEMLLTRITQSKFKQFAKENPESSIRFIEGKEYLESPDEFYSNLSTGWQDEIDNFKVLSESVLPEGVKLGVSYTTWVLNSPLYLQFLYRKLFHQYGVNFVTEKLENLQQVNQFVENNPIIINCTGNGLLYHGGNDPANYPIRGQTLLVRPPITNLIDSTITHQLKDGIWTFCIPRPLNGGVILGGTKQIGDTCSDIRSEDTKQLITNGYKLFPELFHPDGSIDIIKVNVGFRPARTGGLNLSVQPKWETHFANHILNNYGAGGMGYELSYGSAVKVVENLKLLILQEKSKL